MGRALHDGSLGIVESAAPHDPVSDLDDGRSAGQVKNWNGQGRALHNRIPNVGSREEDDSDTQPDANEGAWTAEALIPEVDLQKMSHRLEKVDEILHKLGNRSGALTEMVDALRDSLEYSQKEVDTLKDENYKLKMKIADLEVEGSRTNIDACYRQGNYIRNRDRAIVITFQKQVDRDMVYNGRMNLRCTEDYKHVWVNEDLGQASKKMRNIIRLIAKQAHAEGIDCRTGKYDI